MPTRRTILASSAGALALAGAAHHASLATAALQTGTPAADDDTGAEPSLGTPILSPAIDIVRAQELALEGQKDAVVRWVKLDGDDGVLHYDVVLDNGTEIEVDATTGEIGETETDDGSEDDDENENDKMTMKMKRTTATTMRARRITRAVPATRG